MNGADYDRALVADLRAALLSMGYDPQGHSEASDREVLDAATEIVCAALAKAKGGTTRKSAPLWSRRRWCACLSPAGVVIPTNTTPGAKFTRLR